MCTGNTIKTTIGNAENCDANEPCNGITIVPNEHHTNCGKLMCEFDMLKKFILFIGKGILQKLVELQIGLLSIINLRQYFQMIIVSVSGRLF